MSHQKGYTLMELMTVIAVVILLSTITVIYLAPIRAKARDTQRKNDLRVIQIAIELFQSSNGQYPPNLQELEDGGYLNDVPQDPKEDCAYTYNTSSVHQDYEVNALLEKDEESMKTDGGTDDNRYEVGTDLTLISHDCDEASPTSECIITPPIPPSQELNVNNSNGGPGI